MLNFIHWDVTPELIDGWATPNWYGLLFVTGLSLGYFAIKRVFKKEGISDDILDKLVLYMVIATIVGARLGHVLFYGPYFDGISPETGMMERGYFSHPLDIFKVWEGGLASHGGILAVAIALVIFAKRVSHKPVMWGLDRLGAPGALAGCFIRLGNLVNSEIVGDVTTVPWGFKFMYHDCYLPPCTWEQIPARHPAQLYEAIAYLLIFVVLTYMYWKKNAASRPGVLFGTFLILLFTARFMIEFVKIGQTARDEVYAINTGQMLSVPFIILGIYVLYNALKKPKLTETH